MNFFFIQKIEEWSHLSDEQLLSAFHKSQDNTFFTELFSRYAHLAYYACFKFLQNEEESREMVMQVFLKILEKTRRDKLELDSFKTWLIVTIENKCTDKYSSRQR